MTFLQLVQALRREAGYASQGPSTVVSQTGMHEKAVEWIKNAYIELQNAHYWNWLRKEFTLTTTASDYEYAYGDCTDVPTSSAITRFKRWAIEDPYNPTKCYLSSSGSGAEYWLTYIDWPAFRTLYLLGTQEEGAPAHISIDPSDNIVLGPTPNDTYVITGEYHKSAQTLDTTDNTDTPEMPSDYHMLIVYTAMEDAGFYDVADEILVRGDRKKRRLMRQLMKVELPKMRKAGPLA